jgi:hypothetical protein
LRVGTDNKGAHGLLPTCCPCCPKSQLFSSTSRHIPPVVARSQPPANPHKT